jgi:hypothetical protein
MLLRHHSVRNVVGNDLYIKVSGNPLLQQFQSLALSVVNCCRGMILIMASRLSMRCGHEETRKKTG